MVELRGPRGSGTAEVCALQWDCLRSEDVLDEAGTIRPSPVLVHDMPKVAVRRFHLPIDGQAAEIGELERSEPGSGHAVASRRVGTRFTASAAFRAYSVAAMICLRRSGSTAN